jgi:ketosteroid isomerase-like protein
MSIEANRTRALEFMKLLGQGRAGEAALAPEFTAWTLLSGEIPGQEYLSRNKSFPSIFKGQLTFVVDETTAEANRVVVQCRGKGTLVNDAAYENTYVFVFLFEGDRISRVAEYFNVKIAMEVLIPVLRSAATKP